MWRLWLICAKCWCTRAARTATHSAMYVLDIEIAGEMYHMHHRLCQASSSFIFLISLVPETCAMHETPEKLVKSNHQVLWKWSHFSWYSKFVRLNALSVLNHLIGLIYCQAQFQLANSIGIELRLALLSLSDCTHLPHKIPIEHILKQLENPPLSCWASLGGT